LFKEIALHGGEATITWGWHTAAVCRDWRILKKEGADWVLTANLSRADAFTLRQRPLLFTVPRKGGFFVWPIRTLTAGVSQLFATLGPPEH
jgi:hypothetical protein